MSDDYKVLAVRYGTHTGSRSQTYYRYHIYGEPDAPLIMDFFFWVIIDGDALILVDTGFSIDPALRKNRTLFTGPREALETLELDPDAVSTIIVSHFHNDHIGNLSEFPNATIVVQRLEYEFWMGPMSQKRVFARASERVQLEYVRRAAAENRIQLVDGDEELAPGLSVQLVGGHCPGQQIVLIDAEQNRVVLASDSLHFFEEMDRDMPASFTNLPDMYAGFETLRILERGGHAIVAGHDPEVMTRFPSWNADHDDMVVRVG